MLVDVARQNLTYFQRMVQIEPTINQLPAEIAPQARALVEILHQAQEASRLPSNW